MSLRFIIHDTPCPDRASNRELPHSTSDALPHVTTLSVTANGKSF